MPSRTFPIGLWLLPMAVWPKLPGDPQAGVKVAVKVGVTAAAMVWMPGLVTEEGGTPPETWKLTPKEETAIW